MRQPHQAVDLAHEILQLCVTHEYGLYHCTGEGICSWYDFASEIIRLSGVDAAVAPCTSEEYKAKHPESADRPKWSALDNRMLRCTVATMCATGGTLWPASSPTGTATTG